MELIILLVSLILSLVVLPILWMMYKTRSPKEMEGIPGNLGWPIVGESFSFISDFSSSSGISSFMSKRQKR